MILARSYLRFAKEKLREGKEKKRKEKVSKYCALLRSEPFVASEVTSEPNAE